MASKYVYNTAQVYLIVGFGCFSDPALMVDYYLRYLDDAAFISGSKRNFNIRVSLSMCVDGSAIVPLSFSMATKR